MPLRSHEDIMVFYKKQPFYNPIKFMGKSKNHSLKTPSPHKNNTYGKSIHVDNSEKLGNLKFPRSVLTFNNPHPKKHPTEKPIELLKYLIKTYTKENDLVLDCCAGSGTTAISCLQTHRNYICIEMDENYHGIMQDRINKHFIQEVQIA